MIGIIGKIFGSGIVGSVERVALEAIQTDKETAEAKSIFVKTLDPNGKMRRELSRFACIAYGWYLVATTILIFIYSFSDPVPILEGQPTLVDQSKIAMDAMTALFTPITASWATIVTASFGVNATNTLKDK